MTSRPDGAVWFLEEIGNVVRCRLANIGVPARPAHSGGNGFGAVASSPAQGQVVQHQNALTNPLQIFFEGTAATLAYSGLAPGAIGLYQFNVVVPNVATVEAIAVCESISAEPISYLW